MMKFYRAYTAIVRRSRSRLRLAEPTRLRRPTDLPERPPRSERD
jgi:hypothetical protein